MPHYSKIRTLAKIWGPIVLSMAIVYWILVEPLFTFNDRAFQEGCQAVQPGMNLQQALKVIETRTHPYYEILDGNKLNVSSCVVTFDNGKVIHVNIPNDIADQE